MRTVRKIPKNRPMDWFFDQYEKQIKEVSELYSVSSDELRNFYIKSYRRVIDKSIGDYYEKFTRL
jgi:hypothetical protein